MGDIYIKLNDGWKKVASDEQPGNMVTIDTEQVLTGAKSVSVDVDTNPGISVYHDDSTASKPTSELTPMGLKVYQGTTETVYHNGTITVEATESGRTFSGELTLPFQTGILAITDDLPVATTLYDGNAITWNDAGMGPLTQYDIYTQTFYSQARGGVMIVEIATNGTYFGGTGGSSNTMIHIGTLKTTVNSARSVSTGMIYSNAQGHFVPVIIDINADKKIYMYWETYMGAVTGLRLNATVRIW